MVWTSNTKLRMGFRLVRLRLTLIYSKGQGQGHDNLAVNRLEMVTNNLKITVVI